MLLNEQEIIFLKTDNQKLLSTIKGLTTTNKNLIEKLDIVVRSDK